MQQQCYIKVTASHGIYQMHPEYPNDNIRSLLRPGDSLVRQQFEFIPSWDQSFFYQPCTPRGCSTKPPCSQYVKHIVRQWLFVNLVVVLVRLRGLVGIRRRSTKPTEQGPVLNPYGCLPGLLLSAEPPERVPRRLFFHGFSAQYQRNRWNSLPGRSVGAPVSPRSSQLLGWDTGQKVGLLSCFLAFGSGVCDANAGASNNSSVAFQENCFSGVAGFLTWLLWVWRNCPGQTQYLNAKVEC